MDELLNKSNKLDSNLENAIDKKITEAVKKELEEVSKQISYDLSVEMAELGDKIIEQIAFSFYGGPDKTNRVIDRLSIKSQLFLNGKL